MCGVPAFSPAWIPFPDVIESAERVSTQCSSQEELESYLDELQRGQFSPAANILRSVDKVVQDRLRVSDGQSYLRVADAIVRAVVGEERAIDPARCRQLYHGINTQASFARAQAGRLRRAIKQDEKWRVQKWRASAKAFDSGQVRSITGAIAAGGDPRLSEIPRVETAIARSGFPGKNLCSVALLPG